ncbi:hypothetical protein AAG570_013856 [Ranatra chinensis]|uniref:RNA 3'-terminal phosphate cyclase-like protein n=1 Tax=Ranatra chinensis TaxID=642074 RepID=A0ABD0YPZ5_9HEMI
MSENKSSVLSFQGSNFMRQRIVLAILTGKTIVISNIRSQDVEPGLREYEVNLLRLVDKLTNGTWLEVSQTGTRLRLTPGSLLMGATLVHECCKLRAIGYYLEVILALAPFFKKPLDITLKGVTNNEKDPSVDAFKSGGLSILRQFIVIDPGIKLDIIKRGMEPEGGGEVHFVCPVLKLKPIQKTDIGKVKRIRGNVFSLRVSPAFSNRLIDSAKGECLKFLPDVFLTADHLKGEKAGKSPGFGCCLTAETTTGVVYTSDCVSLPPPAPRLLPEDLGREAAWRLFDEISIGGIVDSNFQSLACLYTTFSHKDVSQIKMGPLTPYTIEYRRHIKQFTGLMYKLEPFVNEDEELKEGINKVLITGVGIGYQKAL